MDTTKNTRKTTAKRDSRIWKSALSTGSNRSLMSIRF